MSNLGFHFCFDALRSSRGLNAERFFVDTAPGTLESGAAISSASVLLFSISYEEDYVGLVRILGASGIEPLRRERAGRPVIIAGGVAVSANPLTIADIVDAVVLGEGEVPLAEIVTHLEEYDGRDPGAFLEALSGIPGVFVPAHSGSDVRFAPRAGIADRFPTSIIVTPNTVFGDTLLVETGRGCPGACAFCLARALYGPYRYAGAERIASLVSALTGRIAKVGLVSTAVAAHPEFAFLVRSLAALGVQLSFSSLRVSDLDTQAIETIAAVGVRSVSLAPESGSERLRYRLGKRVPNDAFFDAAAKLLEAGVRHFNLYLLVGCPGGGPGSLEETAQFLRRFKRSIGGRAFTVHVNIAVPKAWTPLQFHAVPPEDELEAQLEKMRSICSGLGLAIKTKTVRSAMRQAVLSLGDERIGRGIVRHVTTGVSWKKAMRDEGVDISFPHEPRGTAGPLPWDRIRGPVTREMLRKQYRRLRGEDLNAS